ncbi:hypothetical protein PSAB6_50249 [Paraburkholderia sabiae]|nr:hypothetical protein PSAB6_50249 [Paraburkholderia sabiae]
MTPSDKIGSSGVARTDGPMHHAPLGSPAASGLDEPFERQLVGVDERPLVAEPGPMQKVAGSLIAADMRKAWADPSRPLSALR